MSPLQGVCFLHNFLFCFPVELTDTLTRSVMGHLRGFCNLAVLAAGCSSASMNRTCSSSLLLRRSCPPLPLAGG